MYKLPKGINIPNADDYPQGFNIEEINYNRLSANIVQGYKVANVSGKPYTHFIEVNIDENKIWDLFVALSDALLDDVAYAIIGFKNEDNDILSNYTYKSNIVDLFQGYSYELTNDGFLTFGIAFQHENSLNEILVSSFKYFQIWTDRIDNAINVLKEFGIDEYENLNFIDEFPVCSNALSPDAQKGIRHHFTVMEEIRIEFEKFSVPTSPPN